MTLDIKGSGRRGGLLALAAIGGAAAAWPAGGLVGALPFAPELAQLPFAATDLAALGAMLYEALPAAVLLVGFALWAVLVGVIEVLGCPRCAARGPARRATRGQAGRLEREGRRRKEAA